MLIHRQQHIKEHNKHILLHTLMNISHNPLAISLTNQYEFQNLWNTLLQLHQSQRMPNLIHKNLDSSLLKCLSNLYSFLLEYHFLWVHRIINILKLEHCLDRLIWILPEWGPWINFHPFYMFGLSPNYGPKSNWGCSSKFGIYTFPQLEYRILNVALSNFRIKRGSHRLNFRIGMFQLLSRQWQWQPIRCFSLF